MTTLAAWLATPAWERGSCGTGVPAGVAGADGDLRRTHLLLLHVEESRGPAERTVSREKRTSRVFRPSPRAMVRGGSWRQESPEPG